MTFQGSEARPVGARGLDLEALTGTPDPGGQRTARERRFRAASVREASRWCHGVFVLNPDLLAAVPGATFVPYASVDIDAVAADADATGSQPAPGPGPADVPALRVAHAPSKRAVKGTDAVRAAVQLVREAGVPITFDLIEGVRRNTVLARLAAADVAVDQLRIGWYGGFALEAMASGCTVVARLDAADRAAIPSDMNAELPIVSAEHDPADLARVLIELAKDPERRRATGRAGRRFARRWHHPRSIARAMLATYAARDTAFWSRFDPEDGAAAASA